MIPNNCSFYWLFIILFVLPEVSFGQITLQADGSGETYELINSVLAPGADVVEVPDCNHESFGRHIDEIFDNELNAYVFRFFIHKELDDDRCINFDRQRNEIKTSGKSPDELLGVLGEEVTYKWKFKLDQGFQPSSSFTHLHQIKAVGGPEDSMPLITLTARKASPDRLELRYAEALIQVTLDEIELETLKGKWLDVSETVFYGEKDSGSYSIEIKDWSKGSLLFSYKSDDIRMWKTDADFQRPKWGIYRELNDELSLRDESVLFADFSIEEMVDPEGTTKVLSVPYSLNNFDIYPNPAMDYIELSERIILYYNHIVIYNNIGAIVLDQDLNSNKIVIDSLSRGSYYTRLSNDANTSLPFKIIKK